MGLFNYFAQGLRVSRLLDLRRVYGPKTVELSYSNGQRTSMKTRIQETEDRRTLKTDRMESENRNNGILE
jgi:hypothetical protein